MDKSYRIRDIESGLNRLGTNRLDVLFAGVTGAGKSTTLNSIFGIEKARVGYGVDPETMSIDVYEFNNRLFIWDSPGLGDGVHKDREHAKKIIDLLYKNYGDGKYQWIDLVIVILEGNNRDMGTTYKLLNEIIIPNFPKEKILVAINKADVARSGFYWNESNNVPEYELIKFLDDSSVSIQRRVKEATGININKPVYYSAAKNYNMNIFMDFIINNMPSRLDKIKS